MRSLKVRTLARLVPAVLTVLVAAGVPSAAHAASACIGGEGSPAELGTTATRATTLCLLNAERRAHDLRPLRQAGRLGRVARHHSEDMVAHGYFAHDSLSGTAFSARIARSGWMLERTSWIVGENLAWGSGVLASPPAIVAAWMASPQHRSNILDARFRVVGIGVVIGVPVVGGEVGATYTTDFGS